AMLFSVPLAILAALFTSVFADSRTKNIVKPTVEMMSAVPSVVVGFLGALWLAPIIDSNLLATFIYVPLVAVLIAILAVLMGGEFLSSLIKRIPSLPIVLAMLMLILGVFLAQFMAYGIEAAFFQEGFKSWFVSSLDGDYDMRNSLIIGIALGFAVIPIIYTISEDAFSSVPRGLTSASLALGATPWQTAWRIILPSASPGVFAAISLGLGRAVGETMIVLMATGNTPIMDVNLFEGFRALSANIAVEIPEAPQGGTLYRVLFLSAGVLLIFTSVLNTLSEYVRQSLAKKFSRF
ncbi:MAG: ABC transporter permease subunit, partial [Planctomycetes bacterium]|nr:ABC transporter permease subunit [Planctomycetota bacterium]